MTNEWRKDRHTDTRMNNLGWGVHAHSDGAAPTELRLLLPPEPLHIYYVGHWKEESARLNRSSLWTAVLSCKQSSAVSKQSSAVSIMENEAAVANFCVH